MIEGNFIPAGKTLSLEESAARIFIERAARPEEQRRAYVPRRPFGRIRRRRDKSSGSCIVYLFHFVQFRDPFERGGRGTKGNTNDDAAVKRSNRVALAASFSRRRFKSPSLASVSREVHAAPEMGKSNQR